MCFGGRFRFFCMWTVFGKTKKRASILAAADIQ